MAQLRIGLAQVDPVVGDLPGNADLVSRWTGQAVAQGCHLVAFPEMVLTGYPPEDLVLRHAFVQASLDALEALAVRLADEGAGAIAVVVGYCGRTERPAPALGRPAGEPQNATIYQFWFPPATAGIRVRVTKPTRTNGLIEVGVGLDGSYGIYLNINENF